MRKPKPQAVLGLPLGRTPFRPPNTQTRWHCRWLHAGAPVPSALRQLMCPPSRTQRSHPSRHRLPLCTADLQGLGIQMRITSSPVFVVLCNAHYSLTTPHCLCHHVLLPNPLQLIPFRRLASGLPDCPSHHATQASRCTQRTAALAGVCNGRSCMTHPWLLLATTHCNAAHVACCTSLARVGAAQPWAGCPPPLNSDPTPGTAQRTLPPALDTSPMAHLPRFPSGCLRAAQHCGCPDAWHALHGAMAVPLFTPHMQRDSQPQPARITHPAQPHVSRRRPSLRHAAGSNPARHPQRQCCHAAAVCLPPLFTTHKACTP